MPERPPFHVDVVLQPGVILTEFAGIIEPMRVANRVSGKALFEWQCWSDTGGVIHCAAGTAIETKQFDHTRRRNLVAFPGYAKHATSGNDMRSRKVAAMILAAQNSAQQVLILSEAAADYIAQFQSKAEDLVTHWENRAQLEEQKGIFGVSETVARTRGKLVTAAGMGATPEVMLSLLSSHLSAAQVDTIARIFLMDNIRSFDMPQAKRARPMKGSRLLDSAISLMHDNIEQPISIREIVSELRTTSRSLERAFRRDLGTTPGAYYRELRVQHAHMLLLSTNLSVLEIGVITGFYSALPATYRKYFSKTPSQLRRAQRASAATGKD